MYSYIEIKSNDNGSHNNFTSNLRVHPDGYAIIPSNIEIPDSFPFVDIEVDGNTVISMTPRDVPQPEPTPYVATLEDRVTELEEENEMISEVLDTLLMGF